MQAVKKGKNEKQIINLPKEERETIVLAIQEYYGRERDEEISTLAASLLLDFFLETLGPSIYNLAIKDAQIFMSEKLESLFELEKHHIRATKQRR